MKFKIETEKDKTLGVSLDRDGEDIDIVVTNSKGEEFVIAYLNAEGLTIGSIDDESGEIETSDGYIKCQTD